MPGSTPSAAACCRSAAASSTRSAVPPGSTTTACPTSTARSTPGSPAARSTCSHWGTCSASRGVRRSPPPRSTACGRRCTTTWTTAGSVPSTPRVNRPVGTAKSCYDHAFVMLAGSSAVVAGLPGADALLAHATRVFEQRFWDEATGRVVDEWDRAWTEPAPYRGLNAAMHSVEAMLAVGDVTGADVWHERAARIAAYVVGLAASYDGRLPEHFGPDWSVDLELNRDRPDDPFKPFGATVGHGLEWSRLLLHVEATLGDAAPAGCWRRHDCSSTAPSRTAGTPTARPASSTRPTGTARPSCASGCTGWPPRASRPPRHCTAAPASGVRRALRRVVGLRRHPPPRRRAGLLAPRARPGQPPAGVGVAGQARPLPRGAGDPPAATPAEPESRERGGPVGRRPATGMMGA